MNPYSAMIGRIQQQRADLELVVNRAEQLLEKAKRSGDDGYIDGAALNLHGFYTGVENIFEDIARSADGEIPKGSDWHKQLLIQMSAEIPQVRPQVIGHETRCCLEEYRSFRHIVRNVYTFRFRFSRVQELVSELRACYDAVSSDLETFILFLKKINKEDTLSVMPDIE